jgi:hypothetical protein
MGGGKSAPPPPPPPPACWTYRSGTSESAMRGYDCSGYRADCTSELCSDINTKRTNFCNAIENLLKNPGGGTCLERDTGKLIGKSYCQQGDRIKSSSACTEEYLGNFYVGLAEAYCKTSAGQADDWCSCYNIINNVCDTNQNAAGCIAKAVNFDPLVEATPEEFKTLWTDRAPCFGLVCKGNKYIPTNANQGCDAPIKICKQSLEAENITESSINSVCNLGDGGDGETDEEKITYQPGSISDQLDKNFRSKLPESLQAFVPVGLEDIKKDSTKLIGLTGMVSSIFSSLSIIVTIIVLLISMTGGKKRSFTR